MAGSDSLSELIEVFGEEAVRRSPSQLSKGEAWWAERYQWLKDSGYQLRPRYAPDWKPSWHRTKKSIFNSEDGVPTWHAHLLDAVRTSDGKFVMLKLLKFQSSNPSEAEVGRYEVEIGQKFSSEPLAADPSNRCVPIYDVLYPPNDDNSRILVMPLLRTLDDPQFDTIGEGVDFCDQIFVGLKFMHDNHVAHRDCSMINVMMEATSMFVGDWHPMNQNKTRDFAAYVKYYTRTQRPPRYYYIDFGYSRRYDPSTSDPREKVMIGGDDTVPEHQGNNPPPQNPFRTDIYCVGNVIRECLLNETRGFEFLVPLVAEMMHKDPKQRPSATEVVERFDNLTKGLSSWKLRSRVIYRGEDVFTNTLHGTTHWFRRVRFVLTRTPSIPKRSS
ncbi:hypothetical protein CONPUDRAFT_136453 [Coniophora puteana RWD-64-598 SS2]|uniref:Protein kinase domain-containing protein n=1 Tax=Coniophora puteana (strain RWD-64-598) TaxID=741705 RepID=A0A5M3MWI7_CONPW|nr:uncharacterized protein CONPUDRAFT_136453 [Coniophora puteana RWD-64-598 SS2]EIW83440.1 hypothetical protein CONPUDRAFT_136453 [Coniophora puteana RWD-64-598 SS2]